MHTPPQDFFVFRVFHSHTSVQASVKPNDFMHFRRWSLLAKCLTPQDLTGRVRSVVR